MNINTYIASLVQYGLNKGLIEACDTVFVTNQYTLDAHPL